jgi:hypothetical protein
VKRVVAAATERRRGDQGRDVQDTIADVRRLAAAIDAAVGGLRHEIDRLNTEAARLREEEDDG